MKKLLAVFTLVTAFYSCNTKKGFVVDQKFADSLLANYTPSASEKINAIDLLFWKHRLDSLPGSYTNAQRYAGTLAGRFHLYADINDIKKADSIYHWLNNEYRGADAGVYRTLAGYSILQHRFAGAGTYIDSALLIGSDKYASEMINFDVAFELGNYAYAKSILDKCRSTNEYGYFFRLSKYQHYLGNLDSATAAMQKAAELAGSNDALKQAALSNTADLYLHASDPGKANEYYMQSLRLGNSDYHSLIGLAWIAMLVDKKDTLAEKIFRFVQQKTKSPEPLMKLMMLAQQREDSVMEINFATEFVNIVSAPVYGNMYNKYLIDIYSNVLNEPAKALAVSERELEGRNTAQTNAWYAWSLYKAGQQQKAQEVYDKKVSGKPLEGLELYYMGMMMKGLNKGYNATQYFKAAYKNRYDLSPRMQRQLEMELK